MGKPASRMRPRSALDVLVDLNDKVASGNVAEYQPVPLGFTPMESVVQRLPGGVDVEFTHMSRAIEPPGPNPDL